MTSPKIEPDSASRREAITLGLLGLAGGSLVVQPAPALAADPAPEPKNQGLAPARAPAAATGDSPGILAEGKRAVFVSGQGPADLKADMETQVRQTMERIGQVLKAGGASFKNVVMIRAYFTNIKRDLPIYRKVRTDYLVKPYPAATA